MVKHIVVAFIYLLLISSSAHALQSGTFQIKIPSTTNMVSNITIIEQNAFYLCAQKQCPKNTKLNISR